MSHVAQSQVGVVEDAWFFTRATLHAVIIKMLAVERGEEKVDSQQRYMKIQSNTLQLALFFF